MAQRVEWSRATWCEAEQDEPEGRSLGEKEADDKKSCVALTVRWNKASKAREETRLLLPPDSTANN